MFSPRPCRKGGIFETGERFPSSSSCSVLTHDPRKRPIHRVRPGQCRPKQKKKHNSHTRAHTRTRIAGSLAPSPFPRHRFYSHRQSTQPSSALARGEEEELGLLWAPQALCVAKSVSDCSSVVLSNVYSKNANAYLHENEPHSFIESKS